MEGEVQRDLLELWVREKAGRVTSPSNLTDVERVAFDRPLAEYARIEPETNP